MHSTGGSGHGSSSRANACLSTRTSNCAEWATRIRPRISSARSGSIASAGGASSTIACEIWVKRWIPRPSGALTASSVSQRSCSSPPPTSTAPISVTSQSSPDRPLVSVSTTRYSAVRKWASVSIERVFYRRRQTDCNAPCEDAVSEGTRR